MNRLSFFGFGRASFWLAVAGMCLGSGVWLRGGEKIVFGSEQSKVNPDKKSQLSKGDVKGWKVDTDPFGVDFLYQRIPDFDGLDLKKEKQKKLKRLEEMNWMFVKPGELQDADEAKSSGRDDDPSQTLVKEDETHDLMFRGLVDSKTGLPSSSGKNAGQSGNKNKPPAPRPVKDGDENYGLSGRSLATSKADSQTGLHKSPALDFKTLFDPGSSSTGGSEKSDSSMASLFKPGAVSVLSREQKANREEYRSFITGSQGVGVSAGGVASELPKLGGASANPLIPKATDGITRGPGLDGFGSGMSRSASGMESPGRVGWNYGGVSGFGTLPPANLTPAGANKASSPSFEPARARGMGSLGGH